MQRYGFKKHIAMTVCFFMCLLICSCSVSDDINMTTNDVSDFFDTSQSYTIPNIDSKNNDASVADANVGKTRMDASLTKIYEDHDSLVADAELVIVGTVKEVVGFINKQNHINSQIYLGVEEVLKGDYSEGEISYPVYGGIISKTEYYLSNAEMIIGKTSLEEYGKQLSELNPDEKIESSFMGVRNTQVGDRLLVYISFEEFEGIYFPIGSVYNSQFFYNDATGYFSRVIEDEESMSISIEEIKALIEITPDNSVSLREERRKLTLSALSEITEKEGTIEERDEYYDRYKE